MSEIFDLLGDPVPEGFGGRGRPAHIPTSANRQKVMLLQAFEWSDKRIAQALGITQPTLRKHYFRERRFRLEARARVEAAHMQMVWDQAKAGNVSAMKEFRKLIDRHDLRALEREFDGAGEAGPRDHKPLPRSSAIGKKEQAAIAAETAGLDSEWGDDLVGTRPN